MRASTCCGSADEMRSTRYARVATRSLEQALDHPFITAEDLAEYRRAWSVPGAVKSALHWYEVEGIAPPDRHRTPARGNYCPDVAPQFCGGPDAGHLPGGGPIRQAGLARGTWSTPFQT